jgi:hypothetical protein
MRRLAHELEQDIGNNADDHGIGKRDSLAKGEPDDPTPGIGGFFGQPSQHSRSHLHSLQPEAGPLPITRAEIYRGNRVETKAIRASSAGAARLTG